jgi:2-desacetyl-2-hydroxyethyl bacteriochlorophyllide A dehydrogenase
MNRSYPMAVVTSPGKLEFQERQLPEMGARDVVVQIKASAICGSDLHIFKGLHPSAALPVTVGHEASGQIVEVGSEVTKHSVGERVTIEPIISCGTCEFCRRGQYHLCQNVSFQYRKGQGAFTPFFVVHEDRVFELPENVSYAEGALVEPLSVALHAFKKSGLSVGHTCAVFGAGAIGQLVTALARQLAGNQVFVTDINPFRLQKVCDLGAYAINSLQADPLQVIMEATGGMGVDRTFEAVGIEITLEQALKSLKKGGTATLLGIFESPKVHLPVNLFVQREISLAGSQGYCWDFQDSLSLLEDDRVDLKALITHRLELKDLQKGFEILLDPKSDSLKVVVDIAPV